MIFWLQKATIPLLMAIHLAGSMETQSAGTSEVRPDMESNQSPLQIRILQDFYILSTKGQKLHLDVTGKTTNESKMVEMALNLLGNPSKWNCDSAAMQSTERRKNQINACKKWEKLHGHLRRWLNFVKVKNRNDTEIREAERRKNEAKEKMEGDWEEGEERALLRKNEKLEREIVGAEKVLGKADKFHIEELSILAVRPIIFRANENLVEQIDKIIEVLMEKLQKWTNKGNPFVDKFKFDWPNEKECEMVEEWANEFGRQNKGKKGRNEKLEFVKNALENAIHSEGGVLAGNLLPNKMEPIEFSDEFKQKYKRA